MMMSQQSSNNQDLFGGGAGGATAASHQETTNSDFISQFPYQQYPSRVSNPSTLWFSKPFENDYAICPTVSSSYLSSISPTGYKPETSLLSENNHSYTGSRYWDSNSSNNNHCSSNNTTASASAAATLFDSGNVFNMLAGDSVSKTRTCAIAEKEAQFSLMEEEEEIKWPDYFQNPLMMATSLQNQNQESMYNDNENDQIKSESTTTTHHFLTDNFIWAHNLQQQQQGLQNSDIQRLTAAYGHI